MIQKNLKNKLNHKLTLKSTTMKTKLFLMLTLFFFYSFSGLAQKNENNKDKTLSPYFIILGDDDTKSVMPLESTTADVQIAGVIADVKITQTYTNAGEKPIEAIYVFPASTKAAVYHMKMTIGDRTIEAKIEEKQKARADYEAAKNNGQTASLLEQQRPNVFQMNVANILPGDKITVELFYTELLVPSSGIYSFAFPTVVGPRFSTQDAATASANDKWISNPYTTENIKPTYAFDITTKINAGMNIQDIQCSTHDVDINYLGKKSASIKLKENEKDGGNRDFILKYRLSGKEVESGLLLFEGKKENFFLAMMQPPHKTTAAQIPPREYVFVVDVSGSMYGFPLDVSKELLKNLIGNLKPTDKFNVVLFESSARLLAEESMTANEENIQKACDMIDKQGGGGGTRMLPAIEKAMTLKGSEDYSRSFIIVTDGYVSVEKEAFDYIRNNLGNANFFAFGIGSSVNRYIIEGIAHVGMGEPYIITNTIDANEKAEEFRKYINTPSLTNIEVDFENFDAYDIEPITIPDVFAERPIIIFGKYKGNAQGKIKIKGDAGDKKYNFDMNLSDYAADNNNAAIKYLWARERIKLLDDYNKLGADDEAVKEVTQLGLKYNLLTNYTSFIAIDSEIRNASGEQNTIHQALPLPQGVSNYAVGTASYSGGMPKTSTNRMYRAEEVEACDDLDISVNKKDYSKTFTTATVQKAPVFIGGETAMEDFIKKNIVYPEDAKNAGKSGVVYINFIVEKDGSISDIKLLRSLFPSLDNEALRIVRLMDKKWKAGEEDGKKVKVRTTIPIHFTLEK
jgi:Ca-activated chloride channel family protein